MQLEKFVKVSEEFFSSIQRFHENELWKNPRKLNEVYNLIDLYDFLMDEYQDSVKNLILWTTRDWRAADEKIEYNTYQSLVLYSKRMFCVALYFEELFYSNPKMQKKNILSDSEFFKSLIDKRYKISFNTFKEKNEEYVTRFPFPNMFEDDKIDVLFNFKFASDLTNNVWTPYFILLGYLLKHITSMVQILKHCIHCQKKDFNASHQMEYFSEFSKKYAVMIEEKFGDHFVYMLLLNGLLKEDKNDNN